MHRVLEFDALRGIASVVILIYHLRLLKVAPILGSAVDLFFVLSGFLITAILLRDRGEPKAIRRFYIRRAFRIWPIYYLALGAVLVLNRLSPTPHPTDAWPQFLTYLPFIQAYWGGPMPGFPVMFVHVWSLAVEEQFYTIWPFVVWIFGRRLRLAIVPLLVLGIVMRARGFGPGLLLTHADGLLLGSWLALLVDSRETADSGATGCLQPVSGRDGHGARVVDNPWHPSWKSTWVRAFSALLVFGVTVPLWRDALVGTLASHIPSVDWSTVTKAFDPLRINLAYLGVVGLTLIFAGRPILAPLRSKWLVDIGKISYGLYLYHPLVFSLVAIVYTRLGLKGMIWKETTWLDLIRVGLSFALAAASWRWIEQPLLRLKDRIAPRVVQDSGPASESLPGSLPGRPMSTLGARRRVASPIRGRID